MGPSSAMRKMRWRNLWQLVFLAASILSFGFLLTEVQGSTILFPLEMNKEFPIVGDKLSLTPLDIWPDLVSCRWFRREFLIFSYNFKPTNTVFIGPAFTGRESTGLDCHLYIRNLRPEDSGEYLMTVNSTNQYGEGYAEVYVTEKLSSPLLESSPPNGIVAENSDAILNCHTSNHSNVEVSWAKDGELLTPAVGKRSKQNRTLTLSHVTKSNTGTYRCMAKNVISHPESNPVQILVTSGPQIKLNPEGTIHRRLNSDLVVECLVDSVPEAKIQWFFNGIEQKETGRIFQVRLRDQNDAGSYTCKATNSFTNHTEERTGYVVLTNDKHLSDGAIAEIVAGCVAGVSLIVGLLYFLSTKISFRRNGPPATIGYVPSKHDRKAVPRKSSPSLSRSHSQSTRGSRGSRSPSV